MEKDFILNEKNDIPFGYNENRIVIMPKDPETIFLYWDFADETLDYIVKNQFEIVIRLLSTKTKNFSYIYPSYTNRDWYYSLKYTDIFKEHLTAELGFYNEFGEFIVLASSKKMNLIEYSDKFRGDISSISSQEFIKV